MANKFHATTVTYFGETFDSKAEGERWLILRQLEKQGVIHHLRRQVEFQLTPAYPEVKLLAMKYIADFAYQDSDGRLHVEDVKGYRKGAAYELFKAKQKMLYRIYGLYVEEIS